MTGWRWLITVLLFIFLVCLGRGSGHWVTGSTEFSFGALGSLVVVLCVWSSGAGCCGVSEARSRAVDIADQIGVAGDSAIDAEV